MERLIVYWVDKPAAPGEAVFEIPTECSVNQNGAFSTSCPWRGDCKVVDTSVATYAKTRADAVESAQIANLLGDLPQCLAGKPYAFESSKKPLDGTGVDWRSALKLSRRHR